MPLGLAGVANLCAYIVCVVCFWGWPVWRNFNSFAFGSCLWVLPMGQVCTGFAFEVCLRGEILCSVDAGVVCLWGLPVWRISFRFVNAWEAYLRV